MKLPFTIKLGALKGVFARLNPSGLLGKVKLPFKLGAKKKAAKGGGDAEGLADDDDMFADLGDLDALDAVASARQRGEGEEGDEEVDYTTDAYTTDHEVDLDGLTSGGVAAPEESAFADLDDGRPGEAQGGIDLSDIEAMPDFEDDLEGDEEEDAAASATRNRKLALVAGGGVAAAVMIGAASWLLLSGDAPPPEPGAENLAAQHDAVVSLDNVPMVSQGLPDPAQSATQEHASASTPGDMPEQGAQPSSAMSEAESALAQLGINVAQEPGVGVVVPSVTKASFTGVPTARPGTPLSVSPIASVSEQTDLGILPKIADDGLTAYDAYARPEPAMDAAKPKIAIIVTGLGMSRAATEAALAAMPEDVALSLDIYARGLDFWVARAREDGHEVLLNLPLEAEDFPFSDPGPEALKVLSAPEENIQKLQYVLSRTTGYFGVLADHGGKFLSVEDQVNVIMSQLKARGLMYVDGGAPASLGTRVAYKMNIPWAAVEMNLDQAQSRAELEQQLQELTDLAQKRAIAIVRVSATPLTMTALSAWIATLEQKGFQLVPVSALAKKQLIR